MKLNSLALFFSFLILFYASCTKITSTDIGTGLIPAIDGVNTKDTTISVDVKNAGDTAISPIITDTHVVGFVNDPLFGSTDAKINFQVSLPSSYFTFETSIKTDLFFDSVVLVLSYKGLWGDSTQPVLLHVNELAHENSFFADSIYDAYGSHGLYNSDVSFNILSPELTNGAVAVDPRRLNDSVHNFEDSGINMIRLKLNDAFGARLLNYDTSNAYKTDSVFKADYLKGLQVSADAGGNSLLKIGLTDPNTKLALYYKYHSVDSAAGVLNSSVKYFLVNSSFSAHSNNIVRNRTGAEISSYLPATPGTNDNFVYIQAGPGTYATITINPLVLASMPNRIIHRAELLMEQATDISDVYLTPPNLFLLAKDDTSRFLLPGFDTASITTADALFSSGYLSNYFDFGGIPKKNVTNNSLYTFNISRYVQGIVTKHNAQHSFVLYAPYNEPLKLLQSLPVTTARGYVASSPPNTAGCGRVKLYGGGSDIINTHRMRLHIVYSDPH